MLIGNVFEKIPNSTAVENMANHLADKVRNLWQENTYHGRTRWEESFCEEPMGIQFLSEESFPSLQGIDYILKWWGSDDSDGLAGELEVLWKVRKNGSIEIYKTWLRLGDRDFILGIARDEAGKRELNRKAFRDAFADWQTLYTKHVRSAE